MKNGDMPANVVTEDQFDRSNSAPSTGLTKREAFAMAAIQGAAAKINCDDVLDYFAKKAVHIADALLKELEK